VTDLWEHGVTAGLPAVEDTPRLRAGA
jgi:hypothetical protein